ncbi:ABC transporter permease [Stenotrophomonas sp. MMGLT7]|uniref:ABC transporter permease n=1 Tax=Stenotrophomonas sp. MMGLT7 TaxID=2901227 RepID=UPI001E373E44|nr:ABC transporter permease [Stenotrophomonas sp. MMGLT7]MCD7099226.1 ABC transporter permease [Stenotrophomonas sp. MMGLT7]
MFGYYFNLALRSFRRNKVLTALMVLAIALGIGASMTTLTVFHVLSGDPLPGRSQMLFHPQLDAQSMSGYVAGEEPQPQLTRYDAEALLRENKGDRQAMMTGGSVSITPQQQQLPPFLADARYTSADMFPMFAMPFLFGNAWNAGEDQAHARVTVISRSLNDKLFGGADSVGRTLRLDTADFTIVGVLDEWRPTPKFYDVFGQRGYGETEQVFLPFSTSRDLKMDRNGSMDCWGDNGGDPTSPTAPCAWIQYWVQLDSPDKVSAYRQYLANYSDQQRTAGRFERPTNVRLRDVTEWMDFHRLVPRDVAMQMWLAFGFLLVCLLNTIGLLLAKFLRRGSEIGVRRALGATRSAVFRQCMVEAGTIGVCGGVLGLGLALLGLWAVRQQPVDYADLARLDPAMLLLTFALSLVASLLAGALPAWRAMQIAPAMQLKSQ